MRNEAETIAELIDPKVKEAGWGKVDGSIVRREFKITNGEINGKVVSQGNNNEIVFEKEQELLKYVYERRKQLLDNERWVLTKKNSTTQPSFLRNDFIDGEITNDTWWEN